MKINLALQCHNFQHRLCWMLSSILQQTGTLDKLFISIACMPNNGNPVTEKIVEFFQSKGLKIHQMIYEEHRRDIFARRGYIRNHQIKYAIEQGMDYIYFTDSDLVFHPDFLKTLNTFLKEEGPEIHNCIYSRQKINTIYEDAEKTVRESITELPFIANAFERASQIPVLYVPPLERRDGGASGGMQVVALKDIIEKNHGEYVGRRTRDRHLFKEGQFARSDLYFRKQMGGSTRVRLPPHIHLQHRRDKQVGHHIEEQR